MEFAELVGDREVRVCPPGDGRFKERRTHPMKESYLDDRDVREVSQEPDQR
jgi:hypothetical protein